MPPQSSVIASGIRDNHDRGTVRDFLRAELRAGPDLDIVTAYFTVFAYDESKTQLDSLGGIRLLFGEAAFIKNLHPGRTRSLPDVIDSFANDPASAFSLINSF